MKRLKSYALLVLSVVVAGCTAGSTQRAIKVEPDVLPPENGSKVADWASVNKDHAGVLAKNIEHESSVPGIRYYGRSPYLLVYNDGVGGLAWEVHMLPDPAKKMAMSLDVLTSTYDTSIRFQNGTPVDFTDQADATALPAAVLEQIKSLVPLIAGATGVFDAANSVPPPHLYKIVVEGNRVVLRGGEGDVRVPVAQSKSSKTDGPTSSPAGGAK